MTRKSVNPFSLLQKVYRIYHHFTGKKIFVFALLTFLESLLKGLGILMVLPLLQMTGGEEKNFFFHFLPEGILRMFPQFGQGGLSSLLMIVVSIFLLNGCLQYILGLTIAHIRSALRKKIQSDLVQSIHDARYPYLVSKQCGEMSNLVMYETNSFVAGFQHFAEMIGLIVNISVMVCFSMALNWKLMVLASLFSAPIFLFFRAANKLLYQNSHKLTDNGNQLNHFIFQMIYNLKYVKAIGSGGRKLCQMIFLKLGEQRDLMLQQKRIHLMNKVIVEPATVCFICAILYYLVVVKGEDMAQVLASIYFLYRTTMKIFSFPHCLQKIVSKMGSINSIERLRIELTDNKENANDQGELAVFGKEIAFDAVSFSFGEHQVLSNVCLTIPKGRTVGIVGESGAGKTTLFDLMIGILNPDSGSIKVDGINYKSLNKNSLRKIFGYVTQDPVIFNDSIANNVTLWEYNGADSNSKLNAALEAAGCMEFVRNAAQKEHTILGEKGMRLSGGQKQRIAIARELFRDPPIIIFDEATSSLDAFAEKFIQESILKISKDKTVVIISHRLSTLKDCDYIYLLGDKIIREQGSWQELVSRKDSRFYQMCKTQEIQLTQ